VLAAGPAVWQRAGPFTGGGDPPLNLLTSAARLGIPMAAGIPCGGRPADRSSPGRSLPPLSVVGQSW
jgi:hypothetical protein